LKKISQKYINKSMKPLVSVIMAVYNGRKFLQDSIESILCQQFKNFEFIIINDGSTDGSADVLKRYSDQDKRVRLIHQANAGLTTSLNRGIALAQGKYIARQDCGDISNRERLARQFEFLENHPTLSACFTWTKIIDELSNEIGEFVYSTKPERIQKTLINGKNIYAHGSVMAKRQDVINAGGYDEQMPVSQDYELWLRFMRKSYAIGAVSDFLYRWRLLPESISIAKNTLQKDFLAVALKKNKFSVPPHLKINDISGNHLLHYYQNIFFRGQYRLLLLRNTIDLFKSKELTAKELFKCIAGLNPVSYKWIFKLL